MGMIGHALLGLAAIFGAFFLAVLTKLASDEAKAWMPSLAERLLRIAIRAVPGNATIVDGAIVAGCSDAGGW
jgi:hypothetical protein